MATEIQRRLKLLVVSHSLGEGGAHEPLHHPLPGTGQVRMKESASRIPAPNDPANRTEAAGDL